MHIDRFENEIENKILSRGKQYFVDGWVEELFCDENGVYTASVEGSELYEVEIQLGTNGEIVDAMCDCPYDWGEYCKHQVAVLYAIREERTHKPPVSKRKTVKQKPDLAKLLLSQSKETLVQIVLSLAQEDKTLRQSLLLRFGKPEDEIEQSRRLVKTSMYSRDGFWEYGEVDEALKGAWTVLQRAEECLETDCERTVRLCFVVLPEAVGLLSNCDDSNGEVGEVLATCAEIVTRVFENWRIFSAQKRTLLFEMVLNEALSETYDEWEDSRLALLRALVICCEDTAMRSILYEALEKRRQGSVPKYGQYYHEALARIQLDILTRWGEPGEAERFIDENLDYSRFREEAIERAMEKTDYKTALSLALAGMEKDTDYAGLMHMWRIAAYQAYTAMGDTEKVLELAEYFLLHEQDGFAYYSVLKTGVAEQDWPQKLEKLLAFFEAKRYTSAVYVEILLMEKQFDRLIQHCKKYPAIVPDLARKFPAEYKAAVEEIYHEYILRRASDASSRSHYQQICELLRHFGKDMGKPRMTDVAMELKGLYPKRPAFQDELNRVQ